jgi:type I restriction enzyme S subunit
MNTEAFLANFHTIANAPNGMKELRQLVMGLALQGKFDANNQDLPANINELIKSERESYYIRKEQKIKPIHFGSPILQEFDIPEGWKWERIGNLCDLQTGATPSTKRPELFGGNIRWLVSGDINKNEIFECEGRISDLGIQSSNCKIIPENSLLIALNGQGKTRATVAILRIPAALNQSLVAMIPFSNHIVKIEFLYLALKYRYYEIRDITGQNQRRGLNMGLVSELSIPLPPLSEQKRIVTKVDSLMALCDRLEVLQKKKVELNSLTRNTTFAALGNANEPSELKAAWARVEVNTKYLLDSDEAVEEMKKTILQNAIKGNLVPQDSNDEPASELLKKIEVEKEKSLTAKGAKNTKGGIEPIKDEDKPYKLPSNWEWVMLEQIINKITDGEHINPKRTQNGIPILSAKNIGNKELLWDDISYVSEKDALKFLARCNPEFGDILVVSRGGGIGRTIISNSRQKYCLMGSVLLFKPNKFMNNKFILNYLTSPIGNDKLKTSSNFSAQQAIYIAHLKRDYMIPLPPLSEQKRIVEKVDSLFAICDKLQKQLADAKTTAANLAKAAVESLTGIQSTEKEKMKAPKTELVSILRLSKAPTVKDKAPLSAILLKHKESMSAKNLWLNSGMEIDQFYQQLKIEMVEGWIVEPEKAYMKEIEESSKVFL